MSYKKYNLYTLQEVLDRSATSYMSASSDMYVYCLHPNNFVNRYAFNTVTWLDYWKNASPFKLVTNNSATGADPVIARLWSSICIRYSESYMLKTEEELDISSQIAPAKYSRLVAPVMDKILFLMFATYEKYAPILKAYDTQKTKLLDQVKTNSSGVIRFNDTPQNTGVFVDDSHTSNITQNTSESSTDFNTPVARLREIEESINETFREWVDVFSVCFIEDGNYLDE